MAGDDLHADLLADFADYAAIGRPTVAECDGHGWVSLSFEGEPAPFTRAARCSRCETAKLRRAIASFIPPRFCEPVEIPGPVSEWALRAGDAEGLYLAGPVGTGKTHTAWMALSAWCAAAGVQPRDGRAADNDWYEGGGWIQPTVVFSRMTDLLDDFRPGDGSVRRVRDCQQAKLLVIDDLGAEKPSEWTQERLYSVVDHRYVNCMPLIVTGNLPPKKLAEQTGDRVASRLAEMCTVVAMTGSDRRRVA